jgi:O-antigen ligase
VFLIPFQTRYFLRTGFLSGTYWEYGTFSLYFTDGIFLLLIGSGILWWVFRGLSFSFASIRPVTLYALAFVVFFAIFSVFVSDERDLSLYALLRLFQGMSLFVFLNVFPLPLKKVVVIPFIIAATLQAILAAIEFSWQFVPSSTIFGLSSQFPWQAGASVLETSQGRFLRAFGTFPHPNMLGGFLSVGFFMLLSRLQSTRSRFSLILLEVCGLVMIFGLLLSFSRSAWIGTLVGLSFLAISWWHLRNQLNLNPQTRRILGTYALSMILLVVIFFPVILPRFQTSERLESRSLAERTTLTRFSLEYAASSWFIGAGIGTFTMKEYELLTEKHLGWWYQPVHNIYLLTLVELGIGGLFFFIFFIGYILKRAIQRLDKTSFFNRAAYIFSLASLLTIGLFDHYLVTSFSGVMMFWLILGCVVHEGSPS